MEQIMVKASRPMQMMKALLLSYVVTGWPSCCINWDWERVR